MKVYELVILGGGASGLFLANCIKGRVDYLIVDKNEIPKKMKISGGGKCNFTNEFVSSYNYISKSKKISDVLDAFTNKDVIEYFKDIPHKKIKNHQYFAKSSSYIISKLNQKKLIAEIISVEKIKDTFYIKTSKGEIRSKKVVVATGGVSYKKLGASDIGYKIAKQFGHTIVSLSPALVGLTLQKEQFWMKKLSGVSLKAKVSVGKKAFYDDVLFSHYGLTGPAILNTSLYWRRGKICIDFLPGFKFYNTNKTVSNSLNLPKRFVTEFLKANGLKDKPLSLSKNVVSRLKEYSFAPAGTFGYERAEVTRGGVDMDELDNLESKFVKNLYFIGEVVDVTGELGGYNFQWCFSSAKMLSTFL